MCFFIEFLLRQQMHLDLKDAYWALVTPRVNLVGIEVLPLVESLETLHHVEVSHVKAMKYV